MARPLTYPAPAVQENRGLTAEQTARAARIRCRIRELEAELDAILLPTSKVRVTVTDGDLNAIINGE